jgi:uncharacterized repeat protein (TIGR01451 family)
MQTKTKSLVLAMSAALMASGAVYAQKAPEDTLEPSGNPSNDVLVNGLAGQLCSASGGANCDGAIPDLGSASSSMVVEQCEEVVDVNVGLDVAHTWVGDLSFTLTSPGGVQSAVVVARPGTIFGFLAGCSGDDILAMLDDDSPFDVEDECAAGTPTIDGIYAPNDPLFAFSGVGGNGTWTIQADDQAGLDTGNFNDWSLELVCKYADLGISKSAPAGAVAGTQFDYSFTVVNDGPADAQNVVVEDVLPAGVTHVSNTGNCSGPPNLTCNLGAIPNGGDANFTVTVMVDADVAPGVVLTNDASVSSEVEDPRESNDEASASTTVSNVSPITLTKTMQPTIVAGTGNVCFNINVANAGPSDVTGLTITDTWTPTPGVSCATAGTCGPFNVDLAAGANTNINRCLAVGSSAPEGILTNTATVTGSDNPADNLGDPANHTDSANTLISREASITLVKADISTNKPVIAGSGAGNLKHRVTVTNDGPSDITGLVIADNLVVPAGVTADSIVPSAGSFVSPNWTLDLAAGASATLTLTGTVTLAAEEGAAVIRDTADVTGSAGGEDLSGDTDPVIARSSIRWPQATFNVNKLYAGGPGPSVQVELQCDSGSSDGNGGAATGSTDTSLTWKRFNQTSATACTVVETVPDGYYESQRTAGCDVAAIADGATYNCTLTNQETVARFHVTKDFSDGSTDDVEVTLACDTGLPLVQSLVIAGGDPTGVTFVVTDYVDGTMTCWVDEVTNTPGYDVDDSDCKWELVNSIDSPFGCVIRNTAQDGTFTVNMEWDIDNEGGDVINEETPVTIWCDSPIVPGNAGQGGYTYSTTLGDGDSTSVKVSTELGSATCSATQNQTQSGVESSGCPGSYTINAGGSASCTFTNSVFFEGIPTLNQYGLALLALLMLGVGMVGFRRFA